MEPKDKVVFFPKDVQEEVWAEKMRELFESSGYKTDRVWSEKQRKEKTPLGLRIYLTNK